MTWLEILAQCAGRATIILAAAFAAAALLSVGRASAALRHFVWTATFAALLLLPAAIVAVPQWKLPQWTWIAPATSPAASKARLAKQTQNGGQVLVVVGRRVSQLPAALLMLWMTGCAAGAVRFLLGAGGTSWMVRNASGAAYAGETAEDLRRALGLVREVRVLESAAAVMPMTWGILRPVVVLPAGAGEWRPDRLRAVLLHEFLHVRRFDLLAQAIAQAACCLYWFHPLAWIAARRLRMERERACDDAVLNCGVVASEYAAHLVDLVRAVAAARTRWADAPAMAEASDLESRVRGLLDRNRNRRPLSRQAALAVAAVACVMLAALASVPAHAQDRRGALSGVVTDPSGAVVPKCEVIARREGGPNQEVTRTNPAGEYVFASIPAGRYTLELRSPGFTIAKVPAEVVEGQSARVDSRLQIGQISEGVTVLGARRAPQPAARIANGSLGRIAVGGSVQPSKLIQQVKPVYPEDLQQLGVQGTVVIRAVVSKEGIVLNPVAVSANVNPRLAQAALDAVRQWTYEPALLNGQPVEVVTTITVDFQLGQ